MNSKIFFTIFLTILFSTFLGYLPQNALAACNEPCEPGQLCNPLCYDSFGDLILAIANFIFTIALALAPLLIVVGGIYIIAAQGDPAKIQNGKNIILYTLIGLLVIFLSRGLITLLRTAIGF